MKLPDGVRLAMQLGRGIWPLPQQLNSPGLSRQRTGDTALHTVRIEKNQLLDILRANRSKHSQEAQEAAVKYREVAIKKLKASLKLAQNGGEVIQHLGLIAPQDYTSAYDTVIHMLELSSDQLIELDHMQFQQYVEDEWSWKAGFASTNAFYNQA